MTCSAQAGVLDFASPGVPSGAAFPQTYGDTAEIDVQYRTRVGLGNTSVPDANLYYFASGWTGTTDVATVNPACGASVCTGEIFLLPASGFEITLNSFQLTTPSGFPAPVTVTTQFAVFDAVFSPLANSGGTFSISSLQTFNLAVTSTTGIRLQWGPNATQVALDSVNYTVSPIGPSVPEASSLFLLGSGLVLLSFFRRRAAH
jgi:hypothetical protein